MLKACKLTDYIAEYQPEWTCDMPVGCPPEDIVVAHNHPFFRLARYADQYDAGDFKSYVELAPYKDWGDDLPLAIGLSIIDGEKNARKKLKSPFYSRFKGIIAIKLDEVDGVLKQSGKHLSHYTWWRTKHFSIDNLKMLQ
jgi:hypothetical protein